MKQLALISISLMIMACQTASKTEKNERKATQEHLTLATLWMQKSAEKQALIYQTYKLARMQLDAKLKARNADLPPAIVTDVDETVLDNSPYEAMLIQSNKSFSPETWKEWVQKANARSLAGAVDFFNYAKSKGVEVFYVTNRSDALKPATIENLNKENLPYADQEHVYTKAETSDKTARRERIAAEFDVLLYLGDNLRDFDEIFAQSNQAMGPEFVKQHKDRFGDDYIVFPNPMYGEWEKGIYTAKKGKKSPFKQRRNALEAY